jgi:hypothetical protein
MPFSPVPATFIDDLDRLSRQGLLGRRGILELGSGHGAFTAVLRELGHDPVTLDRAGPERGQRPLVVGDVLAPPLRRGFGIVVAANLLRHVWPAVRSHGPVVWRDLLADGGCLWILEDEPCARPRAARNYRDLQTLLAELQPGEHGRLLASRTFLAARDRWGWPPAWSGGEAENRWPADVEAIASMLASGDPAPGSAVSELLGSIRREGLSYGRYWWARWSGE